VGILSSSGLRGCVKKWPELSQGGAINVRAIVLFLAYLVSLVMLAAAYGAESPPIPTPSPLAEDTAF